MLILRISSIQVCFTSQPSFRSITLRFICLSVRPFISLPSPLPQQQTISATRYFASTHTRSFTRPDASSHTKYSRYIVQPGLQSLRHKYLFTSLSAAKTHPLTVLQAHKKVLSKVYKSVLRVFEPCLQAI